MNLNEGFSSSDDGEATMPGELSDIAKDEVYAIISEIFHENATAWQLIDQGDSEEAGTCLNDIKEKCDEILAKIVAAKEAAKQ